jgi:hypothetical protein
MIEQWDSPAGKNVVLPPDRTRETQPLNRLVVPEPSPFDMLDTPPSDESLWGGLHLDDIQARLRPRDAMAELEEAIRLSGSDGFPIREHDPEPSPDDTQPVLPVLPPAVPSRRLVEDTPGSIAEKKPAISTFPLEPAALTTQPIKTPRLNASDRFSRLFHPTTPFAGALDELSRTDQRERVADVLLNVTEPYFQRRLLLAARKQRVIGWRGEGDGLVTLRVHALNFVPETSPIFLALSNGSPFWLGTMVENEVHSKIVATFGGDWPRDCLVLPITVRDRTIAYFYADNRDGSVAGAPISELQPVLAAASVGLMRFIQERRLRKATI